MKTMTDDRSDQPASVRTFVRARQYGVLSTLSVDVPGYPFGSITPYVVTHEGRVVILVSEIAQHTKNMRACSKASLLVSDEKADDKQAAGRVTIVGDVARVPDHAIELVKARYLRCFPGHKSYDQAHDFRYFQLSPVRVRFIGGFGDIHWIESADWLLPTPDWATEEQDIIDHMNHDHGDALIDMCRGFFKLEVDEASLINVDSEGFHVAAGGDIHYLRFSSRCQSNHDVRAEMVRLAREAQTAVSDS